MDDDYERHIAAGEVAVACRDDAIAAVAVIVRHPGYLLLDNTAVDPTYKRTRAWSGGGAFRGNRSTPTGLTCIRLFTRVRMTSNVRSYKRAGFHETGRATVDGFDRVVLESRSLTSSGPVHPRC